VSRAALSRLALASVVRAGRAMKHEGSFAWMSDMLAIAEVRRRLAG
jgi:hypothetical protein